MKSKFLSLTALAALLITGCARDPMPVASGLDEPSEQTFQGPSGAVPGHVRVKFKHEPTDTKADGLDFGALGTYTMTRTFPEAGRFEERHRRAGLHLWYDIHFDPALPLSKAGRTLVDSDQVETFEFVYLTRATELSYPFTDPLLDQQWHLQNPGGKDQWAEGCDVNAFRAWTIETGKPEVIVAVNDMGVDYTHEDLAANMWINTAEYNGKPGEDDDDNGYVDDIYGYSFMSLDGESLVGKIEPGDHGTHVAGTIAAVNGNGIGVCGVAGGDGPPGDAGGGQQDDPRYRPVCPRAELGRIREHHFGKVRRHDARAVQRGGSGARYRPAEYRPGKCEYCHRRAASYGAG